MKADTGHAPYSGYRALNGKANKTVLYQTKKGKRMRTRLTSLFVLALCAAGSLSAQPSPKQTAPEAESPRLTEEERIQRQANRMADELMLDDKTSAKFVDVYQQYLTEMKGCREEYRKTTAPNGRPQKPSERVRGQKPDLTDAEIEARIENRFAHSRKMLDIREKYYKELKKILTPRQLQKIYDKQPAFAGPHPQKHRIGHKHGRHAMPCQGCPPRHW